MQESRTDPDPAAFQEWCGKVLVGLLVRIGVERDQATAVANDVAVRGRAFAAMTKAERRALAAPSFEEAFYYMPDDASPELRAQVGAVVRNSALEHVHAEGPVNAGGLTVITETAAAPLSHLLAAADRGIAPPTPQEASDLLVRSRGLANQYPRAWGALDALGDLTATAGGRASWRVPSGTAIPDLPDPVRKTKRSADGGHILLDALSPDFDVDTIEMMKGIAKEPGGMLFVTALSRLSRDLGKLLLLLEFLLGSGAEILTTNYLLRPGEAFLRRRIVGVETHATTLPPDTGGLSGAHRKTYERYLAARS